ncbi:MAG: hypothetical protein U9O94_09075, partial [Nanoarchaeota archaeon]|nr:hypothetical protein [Nanoarchaeota archaeon]
MGDFGVVATLVGTKIKALALALKGLVLSNPYLAALTAALVVAAAAFDLFSTSAVEAAEASDEAHKSFAELDTKLGVLDSYKDKVAGLSNSSDEFRQENLKLRDSLGDVIAEYGELYTEAVAASDSINIITGEITDSGTAIAAYAIELEKLRIEKLQQSISSLNTALKETTGNIERASGSFNRMWNAIKNVVSWLGKLPAAFLAFLLPGVSGTEALTEALDELISKSSDAGNASELGKAFLDAIEHGNVSIEKMREMKAQLEEIGTRVDLPKNIELAITKFDELGTQVDTILTDMIQKEGFDFQLMTDEEVAIALDNLGYMENKTELFTKTVQLRVTEIKESFRSLTKSWREDLKSEQFQLKDLLSAEGYTEILNSAIGDVGVFVNAITTANEDEIAGHLKAKQALLDKQDVARAVFAASAKSAEDTTKLVILEKQYAEEAAQIHADLFKNEAVYQQKRLMDVANTANAEIKALEIKYKGVVNGEKKIASETVRIKRKLAQEVASITALTYTPKEAMIQFKLDSEERKKAHTQTLFDISMAEAKGVIDHEQAEQQKLDATLDSLAEQARASKKIAEDMAIHAPGSAATAEKQRIADAEKYQAAKLKKVEHYNKEYLRLTKKLADDVKKVEDEGAKNTKTVTDFKIAAGEADIAAEEEY